LDRLLFARSIGSDNRISIPAKIAAGKRGVKFDAGKYLWRNSGTGVMSDVHSDLITPLEQVRWCA